MKIEQRLVRMNEEDVIEIGSALEKFYNGSAGTIIRAMVNAITLEQFTAVEDNKTSSDKRLGRAEGVNMLINRIEMAIDNMQRREAEVREEQQLGE
jgi:hypothetical protein